MRALIAGVAAAVLVCAVASAAELATPQGRDEVDTMLDRYNLRPAFTKLGRGASNLVGGWLEVPLNIHEKYSTTDTAGSMLTGAGIGAFKGLVRTGVGAYEIVTFFLPLPENFAPILPTLAYYHKTNRREPLPLE